MTWFIWWHKMLIRKLWFYKSQVFLERDLKEGLNKDELNKNYQDRCDEESENNLDK